MSSWCDLHMFSFDEAEDVLDETKGTGPAT